jgi:hypothetical protein
MDAVGLQGVTSNQCIADNNLIKEDSTLCGNYQQLQSHSNKHHPFRWLPLLQEVPYNALILEPTTAVHITVPVLHQPKDP